MGERGEEGEEEAAEALAIEARSCSMYAAGAERSRQRSCA